MKRELSTLLLAALCACSGPQPSTDEAPAAASTPRSAQDTGADTAHADSRVSANPTGPASTDSGIGAMPRDPGPADAPVRGIAVGEPNPSAPQSDNGLPSFEGYGDLRLGMPVAAARKTWQGELHGDAVDSGACGYLLPKWSPGSARFGLMFDGGRFVRYDVGTDKESAPGGGRVGMTQAQVSALYPGRVTVQPHKYVSGGKTLRVPDSAGGKSALVFETDETGKITSWRVGLAPQVDYVEGCS